MAIAVEDGFDFRIKLNEIAVGCAQTVKFGASRESKSTSCYSSGDTKESKPGLKSYTLSTDGLMRVTTGTDVASNLVIKQLEAYFESGELLDFEFGTDTVGATKKTGTCWISSLEQTAGTTDDAKFSATFEVTGPVAYATNA